VRGPESWSEILIFAEAEFFPLARRQSRRIGKKERSQMPRTISIHTVYIHSAASVLHCASSFLFRLPPLRSTAYSSRPTQDLSRRRISIATLSCQLDNTCASARERMPTTSVTGARPGSCRLAWQRIFRRTPALILYSGWDALVTILLR
jgi:hypothetical protein